MSNNKQGSIYIPDDPGCPYCADKKETIDMLRDKLVECHNKNTELKGDIARHNKISTFIDE